VSLKIHVFWGERLLMFASISVPSPSNTKNSRACPLKMEAIKSLKMLETTPPITVHHIPKDLNPWEHSAFMLTCLWECCKKSLERNQI